MKIKEFKKIYKKCFPVGEGWRKLVEKLVSDIEKIDPDISIAQVKEKFGGLRFYIVGGDENVYRLINAAVQNSLKICEQCGTKENVTTKGGWILTLCEKCRRTRNG